VTAICPENRVCHQHQHQQQQKQQQQKFTNTES